ncbi:hypothetical protein VPHF86_0121 [Vibrio phage F86]
MELALIIAFIIFAIAVIVTAKRKTKRNVSNAAAEELAANRHREQIECVRAISSAPHRPSRTSEFKRPRSAESSRSRSSDMSHSTHDTFGD